MASDILAAKADLVPIGEDQLPHLELTREIVAKFNGAFKPVLKEPSPLIGRVARLMGIDGNAKMSKSLDNTIYLDESTQLLKEKIKRMYTDPTRIHATDPGKVEGNPVFDYHDAFNPNKEEVTDLKERYVQGKVGDVEVKDKLFIAMETLIAPMRERYITYAQKPDFVYELLHEGTKKVRRMAESTLDEVKEAMYLPKF